MTIGLPMIRVFLFMLLYPGGAIFSQQKNSIRLSTGVSFPAGNFGAKNTSDSRSGFANAGVNASLRYSRTIRNSFKLAACLRIRRNSFDLDPIMQNYQRSNPNFSWQKNKPVWKSYALLVGTENNFRLSTNTSIGLVILAGLGKTTMPELMIAGTGLNSKINYDRTQGSANSFSASLGMNLTKRLGKKTFLSIAGDYWYLKPTFKKITESYFNHTGNIATAFSFTSSYSLEASTINLTAGLIVEF